MVGIAWSEVLESSEGGRVATVSVSHAGQVGADDPDKKGYPSPPVGCWPWYVTARPVQNAYV